MIELENPMAVGDYYQYDVSDLIAELDTKKAREAFVADKGLEWASASIGFHVDDCCVECIQDMLTEAYHMFDRHDPAKINEWNAKLVRTVPYESMYHEWLLNLRERL